MTTKAKRATPESSRIATMAQKLPLARGLIMSCTRKLSRKMTTVSTVMQYETTIPGGWLKG